MEENADHSQPRHTPYQTQSASAAPAATLPTKTPKETAVARSAAASSSQGKASISARKPLPPTKALKSKARIDSAVLNPAESISSNSPVPVSASSAVTPLLDLHTRIDNTKYVFHLADHRCVIEDHENNVFELDFRNPMEPKVSLAGEVEGLKPRAITEKTIEAKVYVINRNGNAIQVVRIIFGEMIAT